MCVKVVLQNLSVSRFDVSSSDVHTINLIISR